MALRTKFALAARVFAALLVLGAMMLAWSQSQGFARAEPNAASPPSPPAARIIDASTVADAGGTVYKLENIDAAAPRARCEAERAFADSAAAEARALAGRARQFEIRATGRSDAEGRPTAYVALDGRDLGDLLVARGLARPWRGRSSPWCDAAGNLIP